MTMNLGRIRWGVRGVLTLGVAASVAANILHARPNPISQTIAAWPPVALLITIELVAKVPAQTRRTVAARVLATVTIAGIAAWVSYWHMAGVASRYGEERIAAHLLPLSVDGLIVVASVTLVELAARIRNMEEGAQRSVTGQPAAREVEDLAQPAPVSLASRNEVPEPAAQPVRVEPAPSPVRVRAPRPAAPSSQDRAALRNEVRTACAAGEGIGSIEKRLKHRLNGSCPSRRTLENWTLDLRQVRTQATATARSDLAEAVGSDG